MILAGQVWSGLCSTPSCPLGACRRLWGSALRVYSKSCYIFFLVPHHTCLWQKNFHFFVYFFNICYDLPLDGTLIALCLWWTTKSNGLVECTIIRVCTVIAIILVCLVPGECQSCAAMPTPLSSQSCPLCGASRPQGIQLQIIWLKSLFLYCLKSCYCCCCRKVQ